MMVTSHGFAATRGREVHEKNEFVSDFHVIFRHGRACPGLSRPSTRVSFRAAENIVSVDAIEIRNGRVVERRGWPGQAPLPVLGGGTLRSAGWMAQYYTNFLSYISCEDGKSAASWSCRKRRLKV
jgi:hypothetical protein